MIKAGFTLIELLIGITILSILSFGSYNNFQNIQTRSVFQTQSSRIYNNIIQIKNSAFNERVSLINTNDQPETEIEVPIKNQEKYIAEFVFDKQNQLPDENLKDKNILTNIKFYYFSEQEDSEVETTNLIKLSNIINNNMNLVVDEFYYLKNPTAIDPDPDFIKVSNESFKIIFDAKEKKCDFSSDTIEKDSTEDINMIKVPLKIRISANDIRPIRYLYLHKKSCLPEIIIQELNV